MIPNSDIYGAPESWIYAPVNADRNTGCKIAPWQTLGNALLGWGDNAPVMSINDELDNTISFCGIGSDSPISTVHIIDYTNGEIVDSITPVATNWCISYYDSRYTVTDTTYNDNIIVDNVLWSPINILGDTNKHRFLRPVVDISPQDFVILIYVYAADISGNTWFGLLSDYENNQSTYPYIITIWGLPYSRIRDTDTVRRYWEFSQSYTGIYVSRLLSYPLDILQMDNAVNYAAPFPRNIAQGSGNNMFVIWGGSENTGIYVTIGGDGDELTEIGNIKRLAHTYNKDWVLSCVASLGLFFTDNIQTAISGELDSSNMYCGTIDDNGITHGEYTRGADNRTQNQYNWESTTQSKYDPTKTVPDYDTKNHLNPYISVADFNTEYVCNYQSVTQLCQELYKALARKPTDVQTVDYSADTFLVTDPLSGIISIRKYPVNVVPNHGIEDFIKIGNYTSDTIKGYRFAPSLNTFITFTFSGAKRLNEVFDGSFLDREPYTSAELYIPFCGTIPISVADYIGHNITVKLAIDYRTGSCTAYIFKDSTPLQSANGQIGIDIPVTGVNTATVDGQLLNANLALKQSQRQQFQASTGFFTTPASIATQIFGGGKFGISGAAGSIGSLTSMGNTFENAWDKRQAAAYELHHIQTPYKSISAGSPLCGAMGEHCCRLTIYRPIISSDYDPDVYAKTIGFACLKNGVVSDFSGLTIGAIDLNGVDCTETEKVMIIKAFADGVYL